MNKAVVHLKVTLSRSLSQRGRVPLEIQLRVAFRTNVPPIAVAMAILVIVRMNLRSQPIGTLAVGEGADNSINGAPTPGA